MSIKLVCGRKFTEIDNIFIDEYMAEASPVFSLIYIYALRLAAENKEITNEQIAEKFRILESDVVKAWKFWKKTGAVKITASGENTVIEFVRLKSRAHKQEKKDAEVASATVSVTEEKKKSNTIVPLGAKPFYTPSHIAEICEADSQITDLLSLTESITSKPLSSNDVSTIVGFYDWLKLPIDVIAVLITYCAKNNKSMRYMEKTAIDWSEKEIKNAEAAEKYLNFFVNDFREVMKAYGITDRSANGDEQKYIIKWLNDYKFSMDMVRLACEKTIAAIGKAKVKYTDSIIENWKQKGLTTVAEVENDDIAFKNNIKMTKKNVGTVKANSFNSYEQRAYEEDELEQIIKRKQNGHI